MAECGFEPSSILPQRLLASASVWGGSWLLQFSGPGMKPTQKQMNIYKLSTSTKIQDAINVPIPLRAPFRPVVCKWIKPWRFRHFPAQEARLSLKPESPSLYSEPWFLNLTEEVLLWCSNRAFDQKLAGSLVSLRTRQWFYCAGVCCNMLDSRNDIYMKQPSLECTR